MLEAVTACRVCGSTTLSEFFDLGAQPFANALLKNPHASDSRYPLALTYCSECSLVQLTHRAPQKELFSTYVWVTGTSKKILEFRETFCDWLIERTRDASDGYVLEIASNDGTLLQPFKKRGFTVLGVDPAKNIAEMAEQAGIQTHVDFWGVTTAKTIVAYHGKARILFARNVLPHVSDQRDFVEGLALALHDQGTLAIEVHYAGIIERELHYDSIYHEHHCYFSLKNLERLLNDFDLSVFDIAESPISGGSIIVYAKKSPVSPSERLIWYRENEIQSAINTFDTWKKFAARSFAHRDTLLSEIKSLKGGRLVGYGASARGSTLLNFCSLSQDDVIAIADKNPLKQGLYTAGTHIPIVSLEEMLKRDPSIILLLAWNFKDEIVEEVRALGFKGTFLVPFPDPPHAISL